MQIELNTKNKTIKVNSSINLGELYSELTNMNIDIDEWCIESPRNNEIINPIFNPYRELVGPGPQPYKPYEVYCGTPLIQGVCTITSGTTTITNAKVPFTYTKSNIDLNKR